jgi:hypothetical protein
MIELNCVVSCSLAVELLMTGAALFWWSTIDLYRSGSL